MNELEQLQTEMRAIRRSLDNCYVENNALRALVETQHLEIRDLFGDVDMIEQTKQKCIHCGGNLDNGPTCGEEKSDEEN
uniref:Uncharacterized protein n=1 Tax=Meloidogyne floridensis TaxID=298350 RepID=A0A915NNM1_9BILA